MFHQVAILKELASVVVDDGACEVYHELEWVLPLRGVLRVGAVARYCGGRKEALCS